MTETRKLRVFLCHASQDKPVVRELYERLNSEGWIDPWLDEEKLFPGQVLDIEIKKSVEASDIVIVCLSNNSVTKEGYIQKELKYVLDVSDEKSEETIYVLPIRLDDCLVPQRLKKWLYVDYFPDSRKDWTYNRLLGSVSLRAENLKIEKKSYVEIESKPREIKSSAYSVEYSLTNLVKQIWTPIAGFLGLVTLLYQFVRIWRDNQSIITWTLFSFAIILLNLSLTWIGFSVVKSNLLLPSGVSIERFRFGLMPRRVARISLVVLDFLVLLSIVYLFLIK